jgi:sialic acid synthase SpsE
MVQGIREVETALGRPAKTPSRTELRNRIPVRKSVVAAANIEPGQLFSESNLTAKRPGDGISAMRYWELLGRPANRSYNQDDKIEL